MEKYAVSEIAKTEKIEDTRQIVLEIAKDFSSSTKSSMLYKKSEHTILNSSDMLEDIVATAIDASVKTVLTGEEIEKFVNSERKNTLSEAINRLSEVIIEDVLSSESNKAIYKPIGFDEILLSLKMQSLMTHNKSDEFFELMSSFMQGKERCAGIETTLSEEIQNNFSRGGVPGGFFIDLFYDRFYKDSGLSKPQSHIPIFESIISYT